MIKKSFYVFFIALLGLVCFGQEICVKGKIVFHKEPNYLMPKVYGDSIYVPYLKLWYKNMSKKDYYFYNTDLSPAMTSKIPDSKLIIEGNKAYLYSSSPANPFNEFLLDNLIKTKPLEIICNVKFNILNHSFSTDSFDYSMSYNGLDRLLKNQDILNKYKTGKQYRFFSYSDKDYIDFNDLNKTIGEENYEKEQCVKYNFTNKLTKKEIINSKKFIFLRDGEEITRIINLRVFMYLNWHGVIHIYSTDPIKSINIAKYSNPCDLMGLEFYEQSLPKKIGRYDLYEGTISGDSVWLDLTKK